MTLVCLVFSGSEGESVQEAVPDRREVRGDGPDAAQRNLPRRSSLRVQRQTVSGAPGRLRMRRKVDAGCVQGQTLWGWGWLGRPV